MVVKSMLAIPSENML